MPLYTEDERAEIQQKYIEESRALLQQHWAEIARQNKREAPGFLAKNRAREGVIETSSGLQYEVLREGDGARPRANDKLRVHYFGANFLTGREFKNTYKTERPESLSMQKVIPALKEALPIMRVGGRYKFYIPPEKGYGAKGGFPIVEPNAVLIFDIDFLAIEKPDPNKPQR